MSRRPSNPEHRGLGYQHRLQVKRLKVRHTNGAPCWWCGRPMYLDAERNWDRATLEGDHSVARSRGGTLADRLLHRTCNRQRQDGRHDHLRPALTGRQIDPAPTTPTDDYLGPLAINCWD
ncbi:hypothetical protein J8M97_20495 [Gordonia polyisoprenivorans]|uniref:hypothetical protein n=1 Tax=Gordonia polyisoprenivorans TaxID=84595 RepID=UPI001B8B3C2E|nr:hypothetical protein [Gordonia polyisoprenivorans]QUD82089.1 hypothetical protein J8M97_20495 [Gordonia polyisoprenivorans]